MNNGNNHSISLCLWEMRLHPLVWREDLACLYECSCMCVCMYGWPAGLAMTAESFSSQTGSQGWSAHTMPSSHGHLNDLFVAPAGRMSRPYIQIRPHALQRVHMYRCSDNDLYSVQKQSALPPFKRAS